MLRFVDQEDDAPQELTRLPGGEQGPSQGPYTPVKRYPSGYMPEGGEPGTPVPTPRPLAKSNSRGSSTQPGGTAQA